MRSSLLCCCCCVVFLELVSIVVLLLVFVVFQVVVVLVLVVVVNLLSCSHLIQRNFIESLAAYSLFCYFVQVKDRYVDVDAMGFACVLLWCWVFSKLTFAPNNCGGLVLISIVLICSLRAVCCSLEPAVCYFMFVRFFELFLRNYPS
jgi:hypothetical protein